MLASIEGKDKAHPDKPTKPIKWSASKILEFQKDVQGILSQVDTIIDKNTIALSKSISDGTMPHLLLHVLKNPLLEWRAGKIRTLSNIADAAKIEATKWFKTQEAKQILNSSVITWINSISLNLNSLIFDI